MKIDKTKPAHWFYLLSFTVTILAATLLRALNLVRPYNTYLLYGHKLNGNLRGLYDCNSAPDMVFLSMDPAYCAELRRQGFHVISGINPFNAVKIARTGAVISDHGLHSMSILLKYTNIPFFDVWHAIPLKGFDADDYRTQHQYDKVFVTSEHVRQVYVEKFGFDADRVMATGYARTDILVNKMPDVERIKKELGIKDAAKKIFLFAPTWQQDDPHRTLFPFDESMESFFSALQQVCVQTDALCIFRTHLNSGEANLDNYQSILFRPHSHYPNTEEILLITDCLISDWSSIVFDFMLLDRPTIFLDVPHPFKKGFSLGPEHLFGKRVGSLQELQSSLVAYLDDPSSYTQEFGALHAAIKEKLYDDNADGLAGQRVCAAIEHYRNQSATVQ